MSSHFRVPEVGFSNKDGIPGNSACYQCWCNPCCCPCSKCYCDPCRCHDKKKPVECKRGKKVPKDKHPNIVAKWKSKGCDLGDSAIKEVHSKVTILGRPSAPLEAGNAAEIRLETQDSNKYVGFSAPPLSGSTVWTLPDKDGEPTQRLVTDNNAVLSWQDCCADTDGVIYNDSFVCLRSGEKKIIAVLANDYNVVGEVIAPLQPIGPSPGRTPHGIVAVSGGDITYTADRGYTGRDSFLYKGKNQNTGLYTEKQGRVLVDIVSQPPQATANAEYPNPGAYRFLVSESSGSGLVYAYNGPLPSDPDPTVLFKPRTARANGLATNRADNLVYYCWKEEVLGVGVFPVIYACDYLLEDPNLSWSKKSFRIAYITDQVVPGGPGPSPFKEVIDDYSTNSWEEQYKPAKSIGVAIGADFAFENGSRVLYLAGEATSTKKESYGHYRIVLGEYDGKADDDESQKILSVTWVPWWKPGETQGADGSVVGREMGDLTYNPITGGLIITANGNSAGGGSNTSGEVDACTGAEISAPIAMSNFPDDDGKASWHQSTWTVLGTLVVSYEKANDGYWVSALNPGTGKLQDPSFKLSGGSQGLYDLAQWTSQPCQDGVE